MYSNIFFISTNADMAETYKILFDSDFEGEVRVSRFIEKILRIKRNYYWIISQAYPNPNLILRILKLSTPVRMKAPCMRTRMSSGKCANSSIFLLKPNLFFQFYSETKGDVNTMDQFFRRTTLSEKLYAGHYACSTSCQILFEPAISFKRTRKGNDQEQKIIFEGTCYEFREAAYGEQTEYYNLVLETLCHVLT